MSKLRKKKPSGSIKVNNKVIVVTLITIVALAALGALLLSKDQLAGEASFFRPKPGLFKDITTDDLVPGGALVRLEVPENIKVGVPFLVDVYLSFSKTNVASLTKIIITSSDKSVRFTGNINDPLPASLGIPWAKNVYQLVSKGVGTLIVEQGPLGVSKINRGRYYLLGSLQMVADNPVSNFKLSLSSSSEAHYFDPEDWDKIGCPVPVTEKKLCVAKGINTKQWGMPFNDLWETKVVIDRPVLVGESKPTEKETILRSYVLKQATTRIKKFTLCVPNPNPCEKKNCGIIDDGCGRVADCGIHAQLEASSPGAVCVDNIMK